MESTIKYVHTNLIAKDWRNLAKFYVDVFDCKPIYPERNLSGEWLDNLTLIHKAKIKGIHLRLPGYENGPTLEIFEYSPSDLEKQQSINTLGFGHIAFHVNNIEFFLNKCIHHGGSLFSEVQRKKYPDLGAVLTVAYIKDPEGNFIELQNFT